MWFVLFVYNLLFFWLNCSSTGNQDYAPKRKLTNRNNWGWGCTSQPWFVHPCTNLPILLMKYSKQWLATSEKKKK
jgi:hypothetical protein